jgi:hypothetical protein
VSAHVIHFGVDIAARVPVMQSAGFQVDLCSSIDSLIKRLERRSVDAVVVPDKPGLRLARLVTVVRSCPPTSLILFADGLRRTDGAEVDLVIPALTSPQEWLAKIAELIAQTKALRAESQLLCAEASLLRGESRAVRNRSEAQRERAEEMRKDFLEQVNKSK